MHILDTVLVSLVLTGAGLYLYKVFKPKPNKSSGCGCGSSECKLQKTKITPDQTGRKSS